MQASPEVRHRNILEYDTPIEWFDTALCEFSEDCVNETYGRINKPEAELLVKQLQEYIEKIGIERVLDERIDFGLISPYRVQVQYIRQIIKRNRFFTPLRKLITIHTVDGFQGQERDVILISLVRANDEGNIGFLNDLRRMNVAITRARMKLIILGRRHHAHLPSILQGLVRIYPGERKDHQNSTGNTRHLPILTNKYARIFSWHKIKNNN